MSGAKGDGGQSTVEYLVVLVAFVSMLAALGAVWHAARDGVLVEGAVRAASHGLGEGVTIGFMQDFVAY